MKKGTLLSKKNNIITYKCPNCGYHMSYLSYGYVPSKIKCEKCNKYFKT